MLTVQKPSKPRGGAPAGKVDCVAVDWATGAAGAWIAGAVVDVIAGGGLVTFGICGAVAAANGGDDDCVACGSFGAVVAGTKGATAGDCWGAVAGMDGGTYGCTGETLWGGMVSAAGI